MEKEYFMKKNTKKVVLLQVLIKTIVKFMAENFFKHLFHVPNIFSRDTKYQVQKRFCSNTLKGAN